MLGQVHQNFMRKNRPDDRTWI